MLSLVVSTLGRSSELNALLESLEAQTFKEFELIVVDQNSDDRLLPTLNQKTWSFPIVYTHTPEKRGLSVGRNVGLAAAKFATVLFPDDDCYYAPWFLEKGLNLLAERGADAVAGRAATESGRSINGRFLSTGAWVDRTNVWNTQIEWVVFFKKTALLEVGGYNEQLGVGADSPWGASEGQDVVLRMLEHNFKVYYDPELYGYHDELNIYIPDTAMIRKGRSYARGFGYVLRLHKYGPSQIAYWCGRAGLGAVVSFLKGNKEQGVYRLNVMIGRLEGWLATTFS